MADQTAGALTFQFKADLTDLKKGLADIKAQLTGMGDEARKASDRVSSGMTNAARQTESLGAAARITSSLLTGMVRTLVGGIAIQGIVAAIKSVAELGDTAKLTGESIRNLQQLQAAGAQKGLGNSDFLKGIEGFAQKLDEAKRDANDLTGQFAAAGIKITDAAGKQRTLTDLLGEAANMVQKAGNGFDKIKIAENLGFTREWVPFLEQGADAIQRAAEQAGLSGNIIDDQLVQKARAFEEKWNTMIASWAQTFKQAIMEIAEALEKLWDKVKGVVDLMQAVSTNAKLTMGYSFDAGDMAFVQQGLKSGGFNMTPRLQSAMEGYSRQATASFRQSELLSQEDTGTNAFTVGGRRRTTGSGTPVFRGGGGGGGGGGETADAVERYLQNLERTKNLLQQEVDLWGKTRTEIETAKAIEAARAAAKKEGRDLTEQELQQAKQLGGEYGALRDKMEQLRDTQQSLVSIGNTFTQAISDWALNGTKAADVFRNLAKSIANMALQATLMGSGPLAGLFGTKASGGGIGGLFGSLLGGFGGSASSAGSLFATASSAAVRFATGGVAAPNSWALVGEAGPELIRVGSSGASVVDAAQTRNVGSGGVGQIVVTVNGARGNQEINSMVQQGVTTALREYDRRAPAREQERMLRFT